MAENIYCIDATEICGKDPEKLRHERDPKLLSWQNAVCPGPLFVPGELQDKMAEHIKG